MCDGLEGDAALACTVQSAAYRRLFNGKPIQGSCVLTVDCGPPVCAIGNISGDAGPSRGRDQEWNESVVTRSINRGSQPQDDAANSFPGKAETRLLARDP